VADLYVRSSDGSNADNGSTWALAKATLAGAAAIDAAGDTIWFSQAHSESTASALTPALAGTIASPTRLLCGSDSAEPPTALSTAAVIATTGGNSITLSGTCYYVYGIQFAAGSGANFAGINVASTSSHNVLFEKCQFIINATSNIAETVDAGASGITRWKDCDVKFGNSGHKVSSSTARLIWEGGSLLSGGTSPTTLFTPASAGAELSGLDLSNASAGMNIFTPGTTGRAKVVIRNSKLPASWSGVLVSGTLSQGTRCEMYNCDSGDTNYRIWIEDYNGSLKQETTIVLTGGASDGTTTLSWKIASSANAKFPHQAFTSPEIMIWNDTTGSSKTVTCEIVHDSQGAGSGSKFQDDEIWLEVMYLGTSGYPLGTWITDSKADVLATAANQADSSVTWTTTGLTTPVKQALSVTFTPQEKGYFVARVVMAKASKTVYVDPKIVVT
jgi:hypothetical protein